MKNQNTEIESENSKSTNRHRRMSLAVQVNLLIVAITLGISLLLVAISAVNYRRAILDPFTKKLSEYEVKAEDFTPYLSYFAELFSTEEMQAARESHFTEDDHFLDWMDETPSFTDDDPLYGRESLFFDIIAYDLTVRDTMEAINLDTVGAEVLKDGTVYRVSYDEKGGNDSDWLDDFGREESFFYQPPTEFLSPCMMRISSNYLLLRCVLLDLDGAEGRLWLGYDMTEAVNEFHGFVTRSILYVLALTTAASVVCICLLRRHIIRRCDLRIIGIEFVCLVVISRVIHDIINIVDKACDEIMLRLRIDIILDRYADILFRIVRGFRQSGDRFAAAALSVKRCQRCIVRIIDMECLKRLLIDIIAVKFEEIADIRSLIVLFRFGDVHAAFADLLLLGEQIDAPVFAVDLDLDEPCI